MKKSEEVSRVPIEIFYEDPRYLDQSWLLEGWTTSFLKTKRAFDLLLAVPVLIVSIPFLVALGILIRLDSPGPILYSQRRIGKDRAHFTIYKLRSMKVDAERAGAQYAEANDPRVTRVGRWLRRTRIDEIPQLWNVIRGEMSIIGPRPERPENERLLEDAIPGFHVRTYVQPGLTGWAQICAPYANTTEQSSKKLEFDVYYIRNATLRLDSQIAWKTLLVMARFRGH